MSNAPPNEFANAEPALLQMKPRVRVTMVAELSGLKPRTITGLAAKGEIPGAAKFGGT